MPLASSMVAATFAATIVFAALPDSQAASLDRCFTESVGGWRGPLLSEDELQTMDSEFHLTPEGTLAGSYHVHAHPPYDGSLTDFTPNAPCEADFLWHDPYGTGPVHIRFAPDQGRFRGLWHSTAEDPGYRFDGDRATPALESRARPLSLPVALRDAP